MLKTLISDLVKKFSGSTQDEAQAARPIRVVVAGHDLKFMPPYIEAFEADPRFELRIDEHPGHEIASESVSRECVAWADVVFCEWALGNLVWYARNKRKGQLLLARLHLQEWHDRDRINYVYDTDWKQVDKLLLTSHHVYEHIIEEFPILRGPHARVLYCPIDASGVFSKAKTAGAIRRMGIVGIVPQRKRIDLALDILTRVQKTEPDFELYIKSRRPEEYDWMVRYRPDELAWYQETLSKVDALDNPASVVWDAHGSDMPDWFTKIGFLISTSDFEGSHQSVAESMAAGCVPIIRSWEGANRIYPPGLVWDTTAEAEAIVLRHAGERAFEEGSRQARNFAVEHFDQGPLQDVVRGLIAAHFAESPLGSELAADLNAPETLAPNVLILGYVNPGYQSGYRIRIEEEIRNLIRWGVEVHFACLHGAAAKGDLKAHRGQFEALGATVHLVQSDAFFKAALTPEAVSEELRTLGEICTREGIGVVHAEALYSTRVALLLREKVPTLKVVFDAHGASPEEEIMGGAAQDRVDAAEAWEKRALAEADLNIFVSEAMAKHFEARYGVSKTKHITVPCCVSESRFPTEDGESPVSLPDDRIVVAYAGTLSTWQCGEEMIRLFAALSTQDSKLHFLLLIPEGDHPKAEALLSELGLSPDKATLRALTFDEVPRALRHAHAGVLLRKNDPVNQVASPTKFAEYLAAGLPVLMTEGIGDFSAIAASEGVGLVLDVAHLNGDGPGPENLQRICTFLHDSATDRAAMARRCQLVAREKFHWDQVSYALVQAYGFDQKL